MAAFSAYGRMASPISATYNSQLNRSALGLGQNGLGVRQDRSAMTSPYKGRQRSGLYMNSPWRGREGPMQGGAQNMGSWEPQRPPGWGAGTGAGGSMPSQPTQPVQQPVYQEGTPEWEQQFQQGLGNFMRNERGLNAGYGMGGGMPMQGYLNQMALMRGQMPQMQQQQRMPMFRAF